MLELVVKFLGSKNHISLSLIVSDFVQDGAGGLQFFYFQKYDILTPAMAKLLVMSSVH